MLLLFVWDDGGIGAARSLYCDMKAGRAGSFFVAVAVSGFRVGQMGNGFRASKELMGIRYCIVHRYVKVEYGCYMPLM